MWEMMHCYLHNVILIFTIILSLSVCILSQTERIRFCVPDSVYDHCVRMSDNVPGTFACITARDKFECMKLIERDEADVTNIDAEDLYLAGRLYGLEPFVVEEYNGNIYKYRAGVLIPRNSDINSLNDLRGKNVCLSAYGQNSGWNIPIGILLATDTLVPDCRGELYSVSQFFASSCAPGKWSEDPIVDNGLKKRHPNLCALCKDKDACSSSDPYAGSSGAIKCITEGQAQVAFTTVESAEWYFRNRPEERDLYQFLCLDGSRMPITRRACEWARRPTNTFVIRKGRGNYIPSIEKPLPGCERKNVTFCVTSSQELGKCLELQKVAYSRRIRPQIRCVNADSRKSCIDAVNNRRADIVTLEAQDFYHAARYDNLVPIAKEITNNSDYAVAVIKIQSNILSLSQLRGKRSCHTGFGKASGWLVPVGTLIEDGLTAGLDCNRAQEVAQFFAGSCVPGAADSRINSNGTGVESLCSQCIGDDGGDHICERSNAERFNDEEGAFRCLAEGRGDVAFVTHNTPLDYTDGRSTAFWSRFIRSADYRLLCRHENGVNSHQGSLGQLTDYKQCNLAKIPGRIVAISSLIPYENRFDALQVVTALSDMFANRVPLSFKLFGTFKNESDLIFSDSTTGIMAVESDASYRSVFEGPFLQILEDNDQNLCLNDGFSFRINHTSLLLYLIFIVTFNVILSH